MSTTVITISGENVILDAQNYDDICTKLRAYKKLEAVALAAAAVIRRDWGENDDDAVLDIEHLREACEKL